MSVSRVKSQHTVARCSYILQRIRSLKCDSLGGKNLVFVHHNKRIKAETVTTPRVTHKSSNTSSWKSIVSSSYVSDKSIAPLDRVSIPEFVN